MSLVILVSFLSLEQMQTLLQCNEIKANADSFSHPFPFKFFIQMLSINTEFYSNSFFVFLLAIGETKGIASPNFREIWGQLAISLEAPGCESLYSSQNSSILNLSAAKLTIDEMLKRWQNMVFRVDFATLESSYNK